MGDQIRIPSQGRDHAVLLDELSSRSADDADFRRGRTWSMIYWAGAEHEAFLEQAFSKYFSTNALNPMAFPSLKRMEFELVQMTSSMLHGPASACGTMSSGGTESVLLAVKTYRDRARRKWPWIRNPNIVAPTTIHPAFEKAAHLFGVRVKRARVHEDGTVDLASMKRKIDRNTILLAASAPQYVTGTVDPIPAIGRLAGKHRLPLHVDACFGGFLLPFLERIGVGLPAWDFRVPEVTSISADIHKWGYAPKGASVIVYRDVAYLRHQFFVSTAWPGGVYASPGLPGTKPGGPIAAAWASLQALGEDGLTGLARRAWETSQRLRRGIEAIEGLRVLGLPHSTVVTWAADGREIDIYAVADQMAERGWSIDRQQMPPSVHCTVGASNADAVDDYLADLRESVSHVRAHPELASEGEAAVYGMMAKIPVRGLVSQGVREVMESMYGPDGGDVDLGGLEDDGLKGRVQEIVVGALDAVERLRHRGAS